MTTSASPLGTLTFAPYFLFANLLHNRPQPKPKLQRLAFEAQSIHQEQQPLRPDNIADASLKALQWQHVAKCPKRNCITNVQLR
jgi:hypothetical protein